MLWASARETRDQRRLEKQPLGVDHGVEGAGTHRAPELNDVAPRRRAVGRCPPLPARHRDHLIDRRMQAHQRRECLLNHPGETRVRPVRARLGHSRHVMDHVAERGGLDEQHVGHEGVWAWRVR
jgi:hypothetical protein